nr:hypothetical protein [Tanacetum cinerariifolium]
KQEEKWIEEEQAVNAQYWKIHACCDDDDDYNFAITPILSTKEPDNSLSIGDEHLDTISTKKSNEVINSSVEDLVPIPSELEGILDTMCDVHLVNNPTPLEAKDHFEIVINSNDDFSSSDDDSLYNENIEYVEASPHDFELVGLEVAEIIIPEDEEIEDDNLHEKLLNVHILIANIEALKDNPTLSSELLTKSSSTSPKSFLEETNTFHNSLPKFKNFCFDLEEISSSSTTTHSDISLPGYEAFYFDDDHIKEISSGSTTTHSDISLSEYDSFIFDPSNDQFSPTDRSDLTREGFADELAHIISPPEYDCFYFRNFSDPGEWIPILNSGIHENLSSTTRVNLPAEDDHSPLLAYVVWIFLAYLTYPVIPHYLHSFGNEDTIFDSGIAINRFYSFKPGLSHRTITHSDISLSEYDSFIFDLSNDQFPPTDRSNFTHEEFDDELAHIISPPEYDCFYFRNLPDPDEWISNLNSGICENLSSTTRVNLPVEDDHSPLLAYIVWIFLSYLTYLVIPLYLHSFGNEDTIFDPGIAINRFCSFKPDLSHRCGTFKKFNTHRSYLN